MIMEPCVEEFYVNAKKVVKIDESHVLKSFMLMLKKLSK